jgi:hypothetical protein
MTAPNNSNTCTVCHPQTTASTSGFWAQLKQVMTKQLDVKDHHIRWAFAAGLVFPALYVWSMFAGNQWWMEFITFLGATYVALTALFALLSARVLDEFKAVMPPLIVSSSVTTVFLAFFTFMEKVS